MSETMRDSSLLIGEKRKIPLILHSAQLLFATIILGLNAYEVRYVAYNVLVVSLVVVSWMPSMSSTC